MMLLLLFSIACADLILTSDLVVKGEKIKSVTYLSDTHFLVDSPTKKSALLYDGLQDRFYIIDHKEKKMTMVYQKDLFVHARKRASLAPDTTSIKKQMPSLYNSELESLLDEVLKASDNSYQKNEFTIVEDIKNNKKWKSFETKRFNVLSGGKLILSLWILPSAKINLTTEQMQPVVMSAKLLRFFIYSMGQETASTIESAYIKILEKEKGLLVFTEQYNSTFQVEASSQLAEFKKMKSVASKLKIPTTYTQSNYVPN